MRKVVPSFITKLKARQIIDSRGSSIVEVDLYTNKGMFRAAVPSGASTGVYEVVELRDDDQSKYVAKGVLRVVNNINEKLSAIVVDMDPTKQVEIDEAMIDLDKTANKDEPGTNAMLAVSMVVCIAGAAEKDVSLYQHIADLSGNANFILPVPAFNIINDEKHVGNKLPFYEFMILPIGASTFSEAMQMDCETYHHLKSVIKERNGIDACNVSDEGGFAPNISSSKEGLELIIDVIEKAGYSEKIKVGIDVASSEFCKDNKYDLDFKTPNNSGENIKTGEEMIEMYKEICSEFPVVSIEDPFDQYDWESTKTLTATGICQVVGDDLLVTNPKRVVKVIEEGTCNMLRLKLSQIGRITEVIEAVKMAKE